MDRILLAFERFRQLTEDLRSLAWCAACAAYFLARERTHR